MDFVRVQGCAGIPRRTAIHPPTLLPALPHYVPHPLTCCTLLHRPSCLTACRREERLYDREAVLGRDASSVFPSETKKLGKMDKDAAAAVLGSMQFVTESQVPLDMLSMGKLRYQDHHRVTSTSWAAVLHERESAFLCDGRAARSIVSL